MTVSIGDGSSRLSLDDHRENSSSLTSEVLVAEIDHVDKVHLFNTETTTASGLDGRHHMQLLQDYFYP